MDAVIGSCEDVNTANGYKYYYTLDDGSEFERATDVGSNWWQWFVRQRNSALQILCIKPKKEGGR